MTDIKAIANRTSIMLKIDMSALFARCSFQIIWPPFAHYVLNTSGEYSDIISMGVCYYTTDSNNVTYIPFDSTQFSISNDGTYFNGTIDSVTVGDLTVKSRAVPTVPLLCLLEGLSPNTTYRISGYYENSDNSKHAIGYSIVTTKPPRDSEETGVVFNPCTISSTVDSSHATAAQNMKEELDNNMLPVVARIYNDTTDVNRVWSPIVYYDTGNWMANSGMYFNCNYWDNNLKSVTIHELQHNYFKTSINSGEYETKPNAIKFMEFATDVEGATWGRISGHYYPIISSERYDYLDDYLICMATDVDYLFGTT